jgi:hypothetical protein
VTEHEQPVQQRSRRTRQSAPGAMTAAAADGPELSAPLLSPAAGSSAAAAAGGSRRAGAPVPLRRPAPAHERVYDAAQSATGSGSWVYTMARSMRLGIHALSPQSLAAVGDGLAAGDDEESGGESDVGSYMSSTPGGGLLAASLGGGGGGGDSSLRGHAGGSAAGVLAGLSPVQAGERGRVVIGFGTPNGSRGAGRLSPLAPPQQQPQQGGLSASLRTRASAAAGAGADDAAGAAGAAAASAGGVRRSSSTGGLARSSSFGSIPRPQQPRTSRDGRPPPAQ